MKPYYEQDGIVIYHGDCRLAMREISDGAVQCVVTSPPYNQLGEMPTNPSGMWADPSSGGVGFINTWNQTGYDDSLGEKEYQRRQNQIFGGMSRRICASNASLFYNHQLRWRDGSCLHPVAWFHPHGWGLRQEIIWNRQVGLMFNARMFVRFDERILWFVRDSWKWNQGAVGFGSVWNIAPEQGGKLHPVAFPEAIPSRCIQATTEIGDVVLDPFMGSGTTLVAAKRIGRKAVGIEIEERYCEIAAKRLAQGALPLEMGA